MAVAYLSKKVKVHFEEASQFGGLNHSKLVLYHFQDDNN